MGKSWTACRMFSSEPMQCPACHTPVPANTLHECVNGVPAPTKKPARSLLGRIKKGGTKDERGY